MDTIVIVRDTLALKSDAHQECLRCVKETGIDWTEIITIGIICTTILIIGIYLVYQYFQCKKNLIAYQHTPNEKKREYEIADRNMKQEATLKDQLLNYLKNTDHPNEKYTAKLEEMIREIKAEK